MLTADDLTVQLGSLPVLRGVSLSVRAGEALALMGGNGSGKSTLVRALLGLLPHQRGAVRLFGLPLRSFRQWSRVGYVPQRSMALLGGSKGEGGCCSRTVGAQTALPPAEPRRPRGDP